MEDDNLFLTLVEHLGLEGEIAYYSAAVLGSLLVSFILLAVSLIFYRSIKKDRDIFPNSKFSLRNILEILIGWWDNILRGVFPDRTSEFLPLIGTLFLYIFLSNLLGFIPGLMSPTTVLTTNLSCALIVFFYYNYMGIKRRGLSYFRHFLGPVIWLAPLFLVVELMSHIVRPISLSVRLLGNMIGDHVAVNIFSDLVPVFVPIFFIGLGIFISFIQAFIFSILSSVYIALATQEG